MRRRYERPAIQTMREYLQGDSTAFLWNAAMALHEETYHAT